MVLGTLADIERGKPGPGVTSARREQTSVDTPHCSVFEDIAGVTAVAFSGAA